MPDKKIEKLVADINTEYGKGSVFTENDKEFEELEYYSSGIPDLDKALGGKGFPRGRISEVIGPESTGKTTLCLIYAAEIQKSGGTVAFIDMEHTYDPIWAKRLGVKTEELLLCQPTYGEEALNIADTMIRSGQVALIIIDSVAALVPKAELEGEIGDSHIGLQARMMSQMMRKIQSSLHESQTSLMFTNQIRMKIGVMFGSPETTCGGNALKFYASIRLDLRKGDKITKPSDVKGHPDVTGQTVRIKVIKNKVAAPFKQAEWIITF